MRKEGEGGNGEIKKLEEIFTAEARRRGEN